MEPSKRVALITGASRGIGASIARRLARDGYRLALLGRDRAALESVAREVSGTPFAVDVTDGDGLIAVVSEIEARVGAVDVLVNNAGVSDSAPLARVTDESWAEHFAVNVTAPFVLSRAIVPKMAERGFGRVVFIASNAGVTGYAYTAAYCASKHAVVGLMRAIAAEFVAKGVTVNAVCPGFVETEMTDRSVARIVKATGRTPEEAAKALRLHSPQHRFIEPDEVAHAVAMLLPEQGRGIHGQAIVLDGGQVMK